MELWKFPKKIKNMKFNNISAIKIKIIDTIEHFVACNLNFML